VRSLLALALVCGAALVAACGQRVSSENSDREPSVSPKPAPPAPRTDETRLATFGGGCFWCTEAVYRRLDGVTSVMPGYSGGSTEKPTYEEVCEGDTGHAEVIQVGFDPAKISYESLLEVFFAVHDPTTLNAQGADHGTQYRSIVLWHDEDQKKTAEAVKKRLDAEGHHLGPIVTQIEPFKVFWPAEDKHRDFFARNPRQSYCLATIPPKLQKLEKAFKDKLKTK
jgi:peptide-methionine (S)-S-oxide reductase